MLSIEYIQIAANQNETWIKIINYTPNRMYTEIQDLIQSIEQPL